MLCTQTNIARTIGGVKNIHRFPARANDAAALLKEVDADHTALLDVFHDLSALLATQSTAHKLIETMRASVSATQVRPLHRLHSKRSMQSSLPARLELPCAKSATKSLHLRMVK